MVEETATKLYVVMHDGMPVAIFNSMMTAIGHSRVIGGPGEGHAIAYVALSILDPELSPSERYWEARWRDEKNENERLLAEKAGWETRWGEMVVENERLKKEWVSLHGVERMRFEAVQRMTKQMQWLRKMLLSALRHVENEGDDTLKTIIHDALKEYPADHPVEGDLGSVPL